MILPEVLVAIAYGSVLHSAESECAVGILRDDALHRRTRVLVGTEQSKSQPLDGLPLQLELELDILHTEVDIVVVELVLDIEGSVVTGVELIGVERAARIERVGEGVDVEAT